MILCFAFRLTKKLSHSQTISMTLTQTRTSW